jgi:hypothetical protein
MAVTSNNGMTKKVTCQRSDQRNLFFAWEHEEEVPLFVWPDCCHQLDYERHFLFAGKKKTKEPK